MKVLITARIKKEDILLKISEAENKLKSAVPATGGHNIAFLVDREWQFAENNLAGRFRIYEDCPDVHFGMAKFEMIFENVCTCEFAQIDAIAQELFSGTNGPVVKVIIEKPVEGLNIGRILNPAFINSLGLALRSQSGLSVSNEHMTFEVTDGFQGVNTIYLKNACKLGDRTIFDISKETSDMMDNILLLSLTERQSGSKKNSGSLTRNDMDWWNVFGIRENGVTCHSGEGGSKRFTSEASASFKTLKFGLNAFFSDQFIDAFGDVGALKIAKTKQRRSYNISCRNVLGFADAKSISAQVTISRKLGLNREYATDVEPEVIRILNVMYDHIVKNGDTREAFAGFISEKANDTCVCGQKFSDTLDQDIVQMGCIGEKVHLMHRTCWEEWKEKNEPKKYDWYDSLCPVCGDDCSSYHTPWTAKRLAWKNR
ncbi:MAG: hypothetical protein WC788_07400 [Candidatus Paceibacterota bacterium]|jgi:hypothetical protein